MQVDESPTVLTGTKRTSVFSPSSSSTNKRIKQDSMPTEQMTKLVAAMNKYSKTWGGMMDAAEDDDSEWKLLFAHVLMKLTDTLANTDVGDKFIAPQTSGQAEKIVDGFSNDDFKEWKKGLQKGVVNGDWKDLVEHRKSHSNCVIHS